MARCFWLIVSCQLRPWKRFILLGVHTKWASYNPGPAGGRTRYNPVPARGRTRYNPGPAGGRTHQIRPVRLSVGSRNPPICQNARQQTILPPELNTGIRYTTAPWPRVDPVLILLTSVTCTCSNEHRNINRCLANKIRWSGELVSQQWTVPVNYTP